MSPTFLYPIRFIFRCLLITPQFILYIKKFFYFRPSIFCTDSFFKVSSVQILNTFIIASVTGSPRDCPLRMPCCNRERPMPIPRKEESTARESR